MAATGKQILKSVANVKALNLAGMTLLRFVRGARARQMYRSLSLMIHVVGITAAVISNTIPRNVVHVPVQTVIGTALSVQLLLPAVATLLEDAVMF